MDAPVQPALGHASGAGVMSREHDPGGVRTHVPTEIKLKYKL